VKAGQWVLAFGSPLSQELSNSVTAGIVSAVGRLQQAPQRRSMRRDDGRQLSSVQNFIQTDAAINPGNSGGPLVDLRGRLVGINTAIVSRTGQYSGIGFAVPANEVDRVTTQLIESGKVQRAFLGIGYNEAPRTLIENEDLPPGASIIGRVEDGSPADEAGLQPGDVITAIDGQELSESLQVTNLIASKQPGDEVTVTVNREGESRTVTVTLGSRDGGGTTASRSEDEASPGEMMESLGLEVRDVTPEIARRLNLDAAEGVIITDVNRSNPMIADSGLQPNMIITRVNGQAIEDVAEFQDIYASLESGQSFRVVVRTPDGLAYVTSLTKPAENG
jgi:serine protease Do